jgi:hypothetical protein
MLVPLDGVAVVVRPEPGFANPEVPRRNPRFAGALATDATSERDKVLQPPIPLPFS